MSSIRHQTIIPGLLALIIWNPAQKPFRAENFQAQNRQVKFKQISLAQGLSQSSALCILQDRKTNAPAFRNYDEVDGLQSNEFGDGASYKSSSGEMFFGGLNGFNFFHPDSVKNNPYIPPVVITDFQIFNKSSKIGGKDSPLRQHISETGKIVLSHRHGVFSFEFAALDYTAPEKNRYAYKMEGVDRDWNEVGTRRFATYTNLDPGEYVFRVRGSKEKQP